MGSNSSTGGNSSIPKDVFAMMEAHLEEVTVELFAAYDLPVHPVTGKVLPTLSEGERSGAAIIGYVGNRIRGALILGASNAAIGHWMAAVGASPGEESDTLGEFSNMLLGRLKGRLLDEGLTIFLATPTTTSGAGLRLSTPPGYSRSFSFEGAGWSVTARLDSTFDTGFALETPSQAKIARAGDAILF